PQRVFKKTSSNGKFSIYLWKRKDYFRDHPLFHFLTKVPSLPLSADGVILVDLDYLKGRKMFVMLICAFCYGHDDLDVIAVPVESNSLQVPLTVLQERLLYKLGDNAYPFTL
uniref:Retinal cone arrestin-3 n=1 Tax=Cavia porcellus TaxID=10141 RepID=A0A286XY75_CAVPO